MYLGHGAYGVEAASRLYFAQVEQAADARGSGADRRHLPDARAPEPVRRHEARHRPPQRRAAAHGGRALHHAGAGRRRQAEADRHARPAEPAARHCAVLRRGSAQAPRAAVRREGAVRKRPGGDDDARLPRCRSSPTALEHGLRALRQASRLAEAEAQRRSTEGHTIDGFKDDRWTRPIVAGDVVPAVVVTAPKTGAARLRIGRYHADLGATATRGRARRRPRISSSRAISIDVAITKLDETTGDGDGHARADAAGRRRAARDRQPHRPDQGDGRRLELLRAASSTARCRRTGSSDRRSSRSSTRRRSIAASRRRRSSSTRRSATRPATARFTARTTTTTSSRGRSRCATRSRIRATSRRSR